MAALNNGGYRSAGNIGNVFIPIGDEPANARARYDRRKRVPTLRQTANFDEPRRRRSLEAAKNDAARDICS